MNILLKARGGRAIWRVPLAGALALALVAASAATARGQDWDPPYCGPQPAIMHVMDHDRPNYTENQRIILYSGADVMKCPGGGMGYDGHSGFDTSRSGKTQGCGVGRRSGQGLSLVYAMASGTVRRSRWNRTDHDGQNADYGLHIDVNHAGGLTSLYGHMAAVFVDEGQSVRQGQIIGAVGTTGRSSGGHLHYQGVRGDNGSVSANVFDLYGWNNDYGQGTYVYPGFPDPHRGDGWSLRVIQPGEQGPGCPLSCGSVIVDELSPGVTRGCNSGSGTSCRYWFRDATAGYNGGHLWTHPNGSRRDYWIRYSCPSCAAGTYLVEAYVPFGANVANAHIARYQVGSSVTVVDQHREGDIWHPIGVFQFRGSPYVELNDRSDRYDYTAPSTQLLAADAVRFTRICGGDLIGVPTVSGSDQL